MAAARLNKGMQALGPQVAGTDEEVPALDATGTLPALQTRATILIVDDEPNNRFALAQVLAELEEPARAASCDLQRRGAQEPAVGGDEVARPRG